MASAQTINDKATNQIIKKEKEKTTATVFIRNKDGKKEAIKRKVKRNNVKRTPIPHKAHRQKPRKVANPELINLGPEMEMEMGMGMEQMPGEMQEGM
jgi:hypothetical protein